MRIKSLLAVIAVMVILLVGTVSANPKLYIEDRLVVPGSVLRIPVMVENVQDLANTDLDVSWRWASNSADVEYPDYAPLTIMQVEKGSLNQNSLFDYRIDAPSSEHYGHVYIAFASTSGISGSGSIAILTAQVANDPNLATGPVWHISITGFESASKTSSGARVVFEHSTGNIGFGVSTLQGDCDGNGRININDAQMALQMVVGKLEKINSCDMDNSGLVRSDDVREIMKLSQTAALPKVAATVQKTLAGGQQASALPGTEGVQKTGGQ
jgi:hypothetical protein